MRHIKIEKQAIRDIDLTSISPYTEDISDYSEAGIEAYKLYAYMSTLIDDSNIIEVGTRSGRSALALSFNPTNKLISYDILEQGASNIKRDNITFKIANFMRDPELNWANIDMIMIDVDPHDGIKEREFMEFLYAIKWEGLLLLDDILPNWPAWVPGANPTEMNNWWNNIPEEKYDLSDVGHFSGSGLVNIGTKFTIELC